MLRLVLVDFQRDLCLMQLPEKFVNKIGGSQTSHIPVEHISYEGSTNLQLGAALHGFACPGLESDIVIHTVGVLSSKYGKTVIDNQVRDRYHTDNAMNPGCAGGPLLHEGSLVGIFSDQMVFHKKQPHLIQEDNVILVREAIQEEEDKQALHVVEHEQNSTRFITTKCIYEFLKANVSSFHPNLQL